MMTDPDYTPGSEDPSSKANYCLECNYGTDRPGNWTQHIKGKPHRHMGDWVRLSLAS